MGVFKEIEKADGSGVTTFYRLSDVHDTVETDDSEGTATVIDYNAAQNKPSVNGVTLVGNKTSEDLGLQPAGDYITNDEADAKFIDEDELEAKNYVNETRLQEAIANIDHFHREIVNALPVTGQDNVLYMVRKQGSGEDIFNEYIWVGKTVSETGYEFIGTTATDLTDYYQKDEVDDLLDGKVDKVSGRGLSEQNYTLSEKTKLAGLHNYDDTELQVKVANLHNYDDTDLQLRVGDLEVKEEADINAISTIQDALDKKMICIRLVEQGDGWTWMDINGSRLTFDRAQAYLGQENCMLFVEQLENDGKVIPAEYKSETTRIRVLFKDLDSLVHIMTLGEEDLLVEDIITTEDGACDFEVENEAVDFGARLDEFYGNTSQEVIAAEAGTEVVDKSISINDVNTDKENYITLKGDVGQNTTTGKNLYNLGSLTITTRNGVTFTPVYENEKLMYINVNGTATANTFYNFSPLTLSAGSYIISGCTGGSTQTYSLAIRFGSGASRISQVSAEISFTLSGQTTSTESFIRIENGTQLTNVKFYPMIRLSDVSDNAYEPYTGGKVSPSLDYSQNIHVVSGDNTFNISGKNKIGLVDGAYTSNNVTITVENGIVKYNGTTGSSVSVFNIPLVHPITLNTGDVTTYSATTTGTFSNDKMSIRLLAANGESWGNKYIPLNDTIAKSSYTQIKKQTFTHAYLFFNPNAPLNVEIAYQLEYGNVVSPVFEPYQGQILSVNLGVENLCDKVNQHAFINIAADACGTNNGDSGLYIPVDGGKYTISTTSTQSRYRVGCVDNIPGQTTQAVYGGVNKDNTCASITIDTTGHSYLVVNAVDLTKIQIEKGERANSYSNYGVAPIELCKIGNYQDYFYKKNGSWYLHKEFGKVDLATLNWDSQGTYARSTSLTGLVKYAPNNKTIGVALAENYIMHTGQGVSTGGRNSWFAIDVNAVATNPASGQKGLLYYQLATPTDTLVTNSTLSSQLDALYNATLYPTTNINTDANDLLPYIDLKYNVVTPAPSPERPSEIKVVKGNNYIYARGKNQFSSRMEQGTISNETGSSGGSTGSETRCIRTRDFIPVHSNTIYTITNDMAYHIYIYEYDKNKEFISYTGSSTSAYVSPRTITTGAATKYIKVRTVAGLAENNLNSRWQLELGASSTTLVPYEGQDFLLSLGQIELCKLGNKRNKIYKQNDTWYLHKEVEKIILTGSEGWTSQSGAAGYNRYSYVIDSNYSAPSSASYGVDGKNNCFTQRVSQAHGEYEYLYLQKTTTGSLTCYIQIDGNRELSTTAKFKTWLNSHNTTVYYVLETSTDTEITDPTLLAQLESLQQITQYKHTYIDLIPDTDSEIPDAQFTYISNAVINASDRILGKDTYWNDEVPTSADLPSNAEEGEIRIVQDTQNVYIYDGYEWIPFDKGGEVDLSNYLAKDNTTAWIPTGAFNPATKKYVDDSVGGVFVPTKTSQLTNDSNFIGKNSNDLTYYYTKTQTYTKSEVDALIGGGGGGGNISITVSGDTLVITTE